MNNTNNCEHATNIIVWKTLYECNCGAKIIYHPKGYVLGFENNNLCEVIEYQKNET